MNSKIGSYNRVGIDLAALAANYQVMQNAVGAGVKVMAIVKSDAYGHGLLPVTKALYDAGARSFGGAEVAEGVLLREAGIKGEITILLGADAEFLPLIFEYDLQPVVVDLENLKMLSGYAVQHNRQVKIHLKIDTGMGRLGIMPEDVPGYLDLLAKLPGVSLAGVMSHFPRADDLDDRGYTEQQNRRFAEIAAEIRQRFEVAAVHIANSAAIMNFPETHCDLVRPGISLYGCFPGPEMVGHALRLQPVMSFKTRVLQVKEVPAGYGISYAHTFLTERPSRLAVLPVGYADGYLRRIAGQAEVIINGCRVPILGRVCMNACLADITDLGQVEAGDEVVLMGRQGEAVITADEIARWSDTISYEILCLFGSSNQRVYL
ncbi:MAG: alanine racemase [Thermodesulfobacteriota bacterium]